MQQHQQPMQQPPMHQQPMQPPPMHQQPMQPTAPAPEPPQQMHQPMPAKPSSADEAIAIARRRLASGEISRGEFDDIMAGLRGTGGQ